MSPTYLGNESLVSHWYADIKGIDALRPALPGDRTTDVCIIGAGFTGLWSAYYLKKSAPTLNITILEKAFAGYGASGRNGGHLAPFSPWRRDQLIKHVGAAATERLEAALRRSVDEVLSICKSEAIDADIVRNGSLAVATNKPQLSRLQQRYELYQRLGYTADDMSLLSRKELADRIVIQESLGALFLRSSARVQPAKLVRGLAAAVERMGVTIHEGTEVERIEDNLVTCRQGKVHAGTIIRATEGYTSDLRGHRRDWLPLRSSIVVTEPLSDAVWREIGWSASEMLSHSAHAGWYAQHTSDGRITMGGRGNVYRFGSQTSDNLLLDQKATRELTAWLHRYFPPLRGARVERGWSGVMGVPRDWCGTVSYDRVTGSGWAGGYVGGGVCASNLVGRTVRDLVLNQDSELTRLPLVNRRSKSWEFEPLRWLGVHSVTSLYKLADRMEDRSTTGASSAFAKLGDRIAFASGIRRHVQPTTPELQ